VAAIIRWVFFVVLKAGLPFTLMVFGEFFEVVEVSGQPSQVCPTTFYIDLAAFAGAEVVPVGSVTPTYLPRLR
jgi:hypothetical protein